MTTKPMTQELAEAVLVQVDLLPKQRGHGWQWREAGVTASGKGRALVKFNRSPERVMDWFKEATASVLGLHMQPNGWWEVVFVMQSIQLGESS